MNHHVLAMRGMVLACLLLAACTPHPGGELVEKGVVRTEIRDSQWFQIRQVWVHADEDGTHIHGKLRRKGQAPGAGHLEITLLDQEDKILYQGTMKPSLWHVNPRYQKAYVQEESFHVVTQAPVPEKGLVRVIYHPGSEHEMTQP